MSQVIVYILDLGFIGWQSTESIFLTAYESEASNKSIRKWLEIITDKNRYKWSEENMTLKDGISPEVLMETNPTCQR